MVHSRDLVSSLKICQLTHTELVRNDVMDGGDDFSCSQQRHRESLPTPVSHQPDDICIISALNTDVGVVLVPFFDETINDPIFTGCENEDAVHSLL